MVADPSSANVGWDQGTAISATTLLTNVTALGTAPVFTYYAYQPYLVGSAYDWIIPDGTNLQPGTTSTYPTSQLSASGGLTSAAANSAVEVVISLSVGHAWKHYGAASYTGTRDPVTDSVSLRLTTPPDSTTTAAATGNYGPCE